MSVWPRRRLIAIAAAKATSNAMADRAGRARIGKQQRRGADRFRERNRERDGRGQRVGQQPVAGERLAERGGPPHLRERAEQHDDGGAGLRAGGKYGIERHRGLTG